MVVDYGNYNIITYKKKRKEKKKEKETKLSKSKRDLSSYNTFLEAKCTRISLRDSLLQFQDFLYLTQSNRIYLLISIEYSLYIYAKDSLGNNLSWYSSVGAWFVINLVMWAHIKFERPKCFSQALSLPLEYIGQINWLSSLFRSRKFLPLYSDTWKVIHHLQTILSHFSFLLNSHDNFQGRIGSIWSCFDSLSTIRCGDHLMLLRQSQKLIELFEFFLKRALRSFDMVIEWRWMFESNIFLVAELPAL